MNIFANVITDSAYKPGTQTSIGEAYLHNGPLVAEKLGYANPDETKLKKLAVVKGKSVKAEYVLAPLNAGKEKYFIPIFLEAYCSFMGSGQPLSIPVNGNFRKYLQRFIGDNACGSADSAFLKAVLTDKQDLSIELVWQD